MNQIHTVGIESDLLGHGVDSSICGVVEGVDRKPEKDAEYPVDPEFGTFVKAEHAVSGNKQENEGRPENSGNKLPDAIPERVAEHPTEKTCDKKRRVVAGHRNAA